MSGFLRKRVLPLLAATAIVTTAAGLAVGQHMRAAAQAEVDPWPAIPVGTHKVALDTGYPVTASFTGQLEPARSVSLAFERQGKVMQVLVEEGERVTAGQVLATLDVAPLDVRRDELLAQKEALKARRGLALRTTGRQSTLAQRGFSSRQTLDEARFEASALAAEMEAIDAAVAGIDIDVAKSSLTAPFAGEIALRHMDDGAIAAAGAAVLKIIEAGAPEALIGLPPAVATSLSIGQRYTLRAGDRQLSATLNRLRPELSGGTRTVAAVFSIADRQGIPFGETLSFAHISTVAAEGAWIPLSALVEGARGLWTVNAVQDDFLVRESVEVLQVAEGRAYVRGTLTDGMRIVASGLDRAVPGQPVQPVAPGDAVATR